MTRQACERLVERYLSGAMTHDQEQEFFITVAVDDELRRTLKSYRIVDEAIQRDRDMSVPGQARTRQELAAILAPAPPPGQPKSPAPASLALPNLLGMLATLAAVVLLSVVALRYLDSTQSGTSPGPASQQPGAVELIDTSPRGGMVRQPEDQGVHDLGGSGPVDHPVPDAGVVQQEHSVPPRTDRSGEQPPAQTTDTLQASVPLPVDATSATEADSTIEKPVRQNPLQLPIDIDWQNTQK